MEVTKIKNLNLKWSKIIKLSDWLLPFWGRMCPPLRPPPPPWWRSVGVSITVGVTALLPLTLTATLTGYISDVPAPRWPARRGECPGERRTAVRVLHFRTQQQLSPAASSEQVPPCICTAQLSIFSPHYLGSASLLRSVSKCCTGHRSSPDPTLLMCLLGMGCSYRGKLGQSSHFHCFNSTTQNEQWYDTLCMCVLCVCKLLQLHTDTWAKEF